MPASFRLLHLHVRTHSGWHDGHGPGRIHRAYGCDLHAHGFAHSVEVWRNNTLVGGLYGVALGKIFFGESMFFSENNASKVALVGLDWKLQKMLMKNGNNFL